MESALLLIDDQTDHIGVLNNIANHLRTHENILVTPFHINPQHKVFWDDHNLPQIDKVLQGIKERLIGYQPSLIVVDQYYSVAPYNGINIIEKLRDTPKCSTCPIFLVSGKREQIVREIFTAGKSESEKVNELARIIDLHITQFLDKTFRDEAIRVLKRRNLNDILPAKLREYEDQEVSIPRLSPKYSNLTLQDLADAITSNSPEAGPILEEMFSLTLSHYINLNEKLQ